MREALEQLALLRFARLIVGQLSSISSLSLIPTIHSFSSLRVQRNTHGVLANSDSSQAMTPSKQKRTHAVFRASSAHRSTSTSKPRFVGEKVRLGDVCTIVSGATPKTKTDEYWDGEIKWITPAELNSDSHYISDTEKHLTVAGYKSASLHMMPKGTVLLTTRAPIGKIAITTEEMCCNQGFKNLVCSSAINNEYLFLYLKSRTAELQAMGRGATFKELSKKNVAGFEINLPAIDRQLDAVAKLTAVESQIARAKQQLDQFDSLVKSRFVEMFGDLEHGYKCSSCKLGLIAEVGSSKRVFKNELLAEGVPFYRGTEIADLSAGGPIKPSLFISKEHYERLIGSTGKPEIGDLLLPSICPDGQIWCVNTNAPFYFKDGRVLWIRPDRDAVDGVYLRHALSTMFQMSFSNIASGTTFAELKIFLLKELNVPLPELKAQKEFVSFATQVDKSRFVRDHEMNFRWERFTLSWSTIA